MAYHGEFMPKNPSKYKGRLDKIEFRSLWELKMMKWCDDRAHVLKWSSEEIIIPYFDPVKNKNRKYFMDFWVKMKTKDGIREFMIEVKPFKESEFFKKALREGREPGAPRPKPSSPNPKVMHRWYAECMTAATNTAKWNAAIKHAAANNMTFMIFTEIELGIDQGQNRTNRKRTQTKNWKERQKNGAKLPI